MQVLIHVRTVLLSIFTYLLLVDASSVKKVSRDELEVLVKGNSMVLAACKSSNK